MQFKLRPIINSFAFDWFFSTYFIMWLSVSHSCSIWCIDRTGNLFQSKRNTNILVYHFWHTKLLNVASNWSNSWYVCLKYEFFSSSAAIFISSCFLYLIASFCFESNAIRATVSNRSSTANRSKQQFILLCSLQPLKCAASRRQWKCNQFHFRCLSVGNINFQVNRKWIGLIERLMPQWPARNGIWKRCAIEPGNGIAWPLAQITSIWQMSNAFSTLIKIIKWLIALCIQSRREIKIARSSNSHDRATTKSL